MSEDPDYARLCGEVVGDHILWVAFDEYFGAIDHFVTRHGR